MTTDQSQKKMNPEAERRNLDARYWGGVLLWAGMIFVIDTLGRLPQIGRADAWSWVFLGAGAYSLAMTYRRAHASQGLRPTWWDSVWATFLTIVGLSGFFGVDLFWPLILIVAALALLGKTWLPEGHQAGLDRTGA